MFNKRNQNIFVRLIFSNNHNILFVPLTKQNIFPSSTNHTQYIHNQHLKNILNHFE